MKLRDFIAHALIEVHHGVQDAIARRDAEKIIGRISPAVPEPGGAQIDWKKYVKDVEFDVAVTVASTKEQIGEAGVEILSIAKVGTKGAAKTEQTEVNRIKFSVPVILPVQVISNE